MKTTVLWINIIGVTLAAFYLVTALLLAPQFSASNKDKEEILVRIENTTNGYDAGRVARPFIGLLVNVIKSARTCLSLSCGVVGINGGIFLVTIINNYRTLRVASANVHWK